MTGREVISDAVRGGAEESGENATEVQEDPGATLLFSLEMEKYENSFLIVTFLVVVALTLLVFNETIFLHKLAQKVPESVLLILLGIVAGLIVKYTRHKGNGDGGSEELKMLVENIKPKTFFDILLPPIILNSAYQLYCKQFIFNLDGILLMAIVGTTLNVFAIGLSLYLVYVQALGKGEEHNVLQMLMLSAIVAAVDPVAVLAVFDQIGVQRSLYILIFGESLLNDGVTVVIFDTLEKIAFIEVKASTYGYAVLSFLPIAFGGALIGVIYGLISSLACKYTSPESKILEPMLIVVSAYLAFLNAQLFHWSGILALIACGLVQKRYGFENTYEKSRVTIELGVGILSTISEAIIFLVLGFMVFDKGLEWDWQLNFLTLFFCVFWRAVVTYFIVWGINTYRLHKLTFNHMFMVWYGGLRGAVSFAMVLSVHNDEVGPKFRAATLFIILVTVGFQGSTIQPLVHLLNFREQPHTDNFTSTTIARVNFHILAGMETILGGGGSTIHYWLEKFERFDRKFMQPLMCKEGSDEKRFAALLRHQAHGDNIQNNVLWGSQDYAERRLALVKTEGGTMKTDSAPRTQRQKMRDIGQFKRAIKGSKEDEGDDSVFVADEHLNDAWKRKLELIKAMKQAVGSAAESPPKPKRKKTDKISINEEERKKTTSRRTEEESRPR